jgi:hypothetical protein
MEASGNHDDREHDRLVLQRTKLEALLKHDDARGRVHVEPKNALGTRLPRCCADSWSCSKKKSPR